MNQIVVISEISLKEQLIKYGYFSEHIPPCFHSTYLYDYFDILKTAMQTIHSEPLTFTVAKDNEFRRTISVPNPEQQLKLFELILNQKEKIKDILSNNEHSLSNPISSTLLFYDEMHFFDIPVFKDSHNIKSNFIENLAKKMKQSMGYKYVYKLDLANFYDTIYTHTIEWAVVGKDEAKLPSKNKTHKNNLGEKLDFFVRNTKNKETSGILTGPFSSRIISEVILNKIDQKLESLRKNTDFQFVHYVDDYEFYFRNESDFKSIKHRIRDTFEFYRLKINENKTDFFHYPYHHNIDLKEEFGLYIKRYNKSKKEQDARLIFFKADEIYTNGTKGAYKYLYKQLEKHDFTPVWAEIEPFIIGHLLVKPSLAQHIIKLIINHADHVSRNLINELRKNFKISIEEGLDSESQWLFWVLNKLNVDFNATELSEFIKNTDDDLLIIMVINYVYKKNKKGSKKIKQTLDNLIDTLKKSDMRSDRWLLIYEWVFNKWHKYDALKDLVKGSQFFKTILNKEINFYENNR